MTEPTHFFTVSNNLPNAGIPFNTLFTRPMFLPPTQPPQGIAGDDNGPPNGGLPLPVGPPLPAPIAPAVGVPGLGGSFVVVPYGNQHPEPAAPSAPHQSFSEPPIEPPGQLIPADQPKKDGWTYIQHEENTTIMFLNGGARPCDSPNAHHIEEYRFSKHKAPCDMTVKELIKQLGCPSGAHRGVTELIQLGDNNYASGDSFTQGGESGKRTLKEVGWTTKRDDNNPIWLCAKN